MKRGRYLKLWKAAEGCSCNYSHLASKQKHTSPALMYENMTKTINRVLKKIFQRSFSIGGRQRCCRESSSVCLLLPQSKSEIREITFELPFSSLKARLFKHFAHLLVKPLMLTGRLYWLMLSNGVTDITESLCDFSLLHYPVNEIRAQ